MRIRSILAFLCLLFATAAQAAPNTLLEKTLFDFEGADVLAKWHVRTSTDFVLTRAWAAQGKTAAAITFHKWAEGAEQWPAVVATRADGSLPVTDFARYDLLQFAARNPGEQPGTLNLQLRDAAGARFSRTFALGARAAGNFSVPVADIGGTLNAAAVTEFHFYLTRPGQTSTVYVDNVRLSVSLLAPAKELAGRVRRLERDAARMLGAVQVRETPEWTRQAIRISSLAARTERFAAAVPAAPMDTWEAVQQARGSLKALETEFLAVQEVLPRLQGIAYAQKRGGADFLLVPESPMRKVFLDAGRFQPRFADRYALAAARNERESFQAVVLPLARELKNITWSLSPLRNGSGAAIGGSVRLVGYVDCKKPSYPVPQTGWWPDPLLDFVKQVDTVPLGEVLPLWVTVDVPENAPAGMYQGKLTVSAEGMAPQSLAVQMEVWDFTLPKQTSLRTALSWREVSPKLYPAEPLPAMNKKYEEWLLREYHLNPGSIYSGPPAWDVERLRELKAMGLNAINLCYVYAPPGKDFNAPAFWKRFEAQMDAVEQYLRVADAAGVRDLCYIYCFDERPTDQLDVVFEAAAKIHQRFPDIKVMTTAYDQTFGLERANGSAMNIWVPLTPHFDGNAQRIAQARQAGRDIWWYICIGPQHPYANWFVEYPAIEARLVMGAMTAKYRPGGFLYYALNRWPLNEKVITGGPRTDWNPASYKENNGDGSVLCAGPHGPLATIRLENIRDGIEDYEYYVRLRQLLREKGAPETLGQVPAKVVENLTTFTEDPAVLLTERARVAREILKLQKEKP